MKLGRNYMGETYHLLEKKAIRLFLFVAGLLIAIMTLSMDFKI